MLAVTNVEYLLGILALLSVAERVLSALNIIKYTLNICNCAYVKVYEFINICMLS